MVNHIQKNKSDPTPSFANDYQKAKKKILQVPHKYLGSHKFPIPQWDRMD